MTTAPWLRRGTAAVWLTVALVAALYCAQRIAAGNAFESNILGLMPSQMATGVDFATLSGGRFDKAFVILLSHPDQRQGAAMAGELKELLATRTGAAMAGGEQAALTELREFFRPYRHQLLSPSLRHDLESRDAQSLADDLFNELHSPLPGLRLYPLVEDPFNLGGAWLQALFPDAGHFGGGDAPTLRHQGATWHLVRGQLPGSPFEPAGQQAMAAALTDFADRHGDARLLRSGLVFHAAEATGIARAEILTVGAGSLAGILLLVMAVFRGRRPLAAIALTLATSVLIALAVSFAVFDRVHLVTLAFGSTLLGLAVDYCFHFLIKQQVLGDALRAGRMIRRGVLLCAGSSIAAYLIQLLSPFVGLHQFAVFMSAGLVGASTTVAVLALYYRGAPAPGFDRWLQLYPRHLARHYARLARRRWPWLVMLLIAVPALALYVAGQGSRDDIRLLNTSSPELLDNERQVRELLGGIDGQRYWVVSGESEQQVLARSEELVDTVTREAGPAAVVAAIQMIPSVERQHRDRALVAAKLYGPDGALSRLCAMLSSDCAEWQHLPGGFGDGLVPSQVPAPVADLFPVLRLTGEHRGVVLLRHGVSTPAGLSGAADRPGVHFVDQVDNLSATLALFRGQASVLLALFLGLLAFGCLFFHGRDGLLVLASVLVSMVVSLASSAAGGVTLFHVLALLLVLGLSLDTAVFYLELGLNGETWLASTLAMATSILAFGLLSTSQVPVLHYFGTVVLSGLLCAWLVTPLFFHLWGPSPRLPTGSES